MHGKEFFMKHNKLFAMLAVAAALAVSACGGNGDNPSSSAHKHSAAPDAPWQHDNNNHWKDCAANDGGKAENAKHTFGDPTDVVPATCTATGSQKVKCTVCGAEVTQTLPMIDHTWGEWEVTAEADCTNAGSRKHTCSVCGTEETETIPANGHTFGEWETVKEATCDKDGSRKHTCSVCGAEETEKVEALGHDLELVGGETPAPDGEATVRLYRCKRCGETSLGFSADEPSEASKPHLMKGDNDGMRFFGRPIGNAMALTADGTSVNQQNNECVYCSTETGDFFEYVFTLNADQAATLASARLYCDARPANYLSGDFWAYNRSADDWTPGYYIDGADDHVQKDATTGEVVMVKDHAQATKNEDGSWTEGVELDTQVKMGARIEDYRYILYVDGQPVDFDADTSVPVKGSSQNMQRAEYVLPYTFNLHEGKNTISLRMAGGYRSEFYNFIFRPYVAPDPVVVNEANLEVREGKTAQITSSMEGLTYASANNQIATVDANGLVTGVKAGQTTITVSKEGNYKDAKVAVKVLEKEGIVALNLFDGVLAPEDGAAKYNSSYSGDWYRNFKKDATLTYTFQAEVGGLFDIQLGLRGAIADLSTVMAIKVNDADVAVAGAVNSNSSAVDTIVGQTNLKVGENTMVITILADDSGLYLKSLKFMPHEFKAIKTWSSEDIKDGLTEGNTLTEKDFGNSLPGVKGYKFNAADTTCTLTYTAEAAMEVELQLLLGVKDGNQAKTGFWRQADSTENPKPEKDSITVNGKKVTPPEQDVDFTDVTEKSDQSDRGTLLVPVWKTVCNISLQQGENTIVIAYIAGGYSLYLCGARIGK